MVDPHGVCGASIGGPPVASGSFRAADANGSAGDQEDRESDTNRGLTLGSRAVLHPDGVLNILELPLLRDVFDVLESTSVGITTHATIATQPIRSYVGKSDADEINVELFTPFASHRHKDERSLLKI